jgi:hypothetical protein
MAKLPLHPKHPERVCWGCDKFCSADSLDCGNGTVRTQHPVEIFGEDWLEWSNEAHGPDKTPDPSDLVQLNTSTTGV